jgi:hypothetical protein
MHEEGEGLSDSEEKKKGISKSDDKPLDKQGPGDERDQASKEKMGEGDRGGRYDRTGEPQLPEQDTGSEAVEEFDQLDHDQHGGQPSPYPREGGVPGAMQAITLLEQWLNQIEGDPVHLLRNQFMLEERRALSRQGGQLIETRPW